MTSKELADLIFPSAVNTVEDYEAMYPARQMPEGAAVTRFAPSPTGFVHIGNFMPALIDFVMAKSTGGINYLRNEDTDKKREVDSAVRIILDTLSYFGIFPDEYEFEGQAHGAYAPYVQSKRKEIYHAYVKRLIEMDRAYPCFCSPEELSSLRQEQEAAKEITGYYGKYAKCRNLSREEAAERIRRGDPYVIRFRSQGDASKKLCFHDGAKGDIELPENDRDEVIMKSETRLPTYHFAHVVDDHLMHTTHVVRGEEWLPSVPLHLEMFAALGLTPPSYIHNSLIMKRDEENPSSIRKISKRKDPEALMDYYVQKGYPPQAVVDAMMMIVNSNYEDWRSQNPDAPFTEFPFSVKKMSVSGAFFDLEKLNAISRDMISRMSTADIYSRTLEWAQAHSPELMKIIDQDRDYYRGIMGVEREQPKPRKDIAMYSEIPDYLWYMYDDMFQERKPAQYPWGEINTREGVQGILDLYLSDYYTEDPEQWFPMIRQMCTALGYAPTPKEYKKNPEAFKGSISDLVMVLRVAAAGSRKTFDLCSIMRLLGKDRLKARFDQAVASL